MIVWPAKDPSEVLDYSWEPELDAGDAITGFTAARTGSVIIASTSFTTTRATVNTAGGTDGETNAFILTVTTSGGRTIEAEAVLQIVANPVSALATQIGIVFPEFRNVDRAVLKYWLAQATERTGTWGNDHATILLAAHYLALNGLGTGVAAEMAAQGLSGAKSLRSGALSVDFGDEGAAASARGGYNATRYGKQFLTIASKYAGGPILTPTGTYPAGAFWPWV